MAAKHDDTSNLQGANMSGNGSIQKLDDVDKEENRSQESHSRISKTENATNSHPLLYSPVQQFPDLIPERSRNKISVNINTNNRDVQEYDIEKHLLFQMPELAEYKETLPEFPNSPSIMKKSLLFDMPIEVSQNDLSDTENDKSVYEAQLSPNLQNVSLKLNDKEGNLNFLAASKKSNKLRKVKVLQTQISNDSDVSSLDTNSDSLKSEDILPGDNENEKCDDTNVNESPEPIEPLSAVDERKHARHWQRMLLPGGEQRTIDMRVIEPYKRVLSHGGYLRAGGHTAIVLFSACHLPDRSRVDYDYVMDNLFLYVLWTLERLVTEDYVLVYLHGGAARLPSFSWLKKCYQMVSRKLRKNLTRLYLVHPTLWIKTMLFMAKPFISSKFYRKLVFVKNLKELSARIPLETAAIPSKVKAYDTIHCTI